MRLIDADNLRDALIECTPYAMVSSCGNLNSQIDMFTIMSILDSAPTIDAKPVVHGRWDKLCEPEDTPVRFNVACSRCKSNGFSGDNYCATCGARMEGEEAL